MSTVAEAIRAVKAAQAVTPPTPATGSTIPPVGECICEGGSHLSDCAHLTSNVNLGQGGEAHPGVTVHMDTYLCACGLFSSPAIADIEAHQEEAGCLS